jgi:peptidoglycan/LPS O-acetylase OafA/YrhL
MAHPHRADDRTHAQPGGVTAQVTAQVLAQATAPTSAGSGRLWLPDALKWLAAHVIVWHHFALYGPLARAWAAHLPHLHEAVATHGRLAVQAFLMLGGFLAMRSLLSRWQTQGFSWAALPRWWWQRYLRLVAPYAVALALALLANAWAQGWLHPDDVGDGHTVAEVLAHLALLHSVLQVESISAGVWYVAVDWQLYVVLSLLTAAALWLGGRMQPAQPSTVWLPGLLWCAVAASWLVFNRDTDWDVWAVYFLGSAGAGALLAAVQELPARKRLVWWAALLVVLGVRWAWYPSPQVATVGAGSLLWMAAQHVPRGASGGALGAALQRLAQHASRRAQDAYALFLIHFAVLVGINTAWLRWAAPYWHADSQSAPLAAVAAALILAWVISMALAHVLYRAVEAPVSRWADRRYR